MKRRVITFDFIRREFSRVSYRLVSTRYLGPHKKLDYICDRGHNNRVSWAHFYYKGTRCPDCYKEDYYTTHDVVMESFDRNNYVLLSDTYENNYTPLEYICPNGHMNSVTWGNFRNGTRCPDCARLKWIVSEDVIRREVEAVGYELVLGTYQQANSPFVIRCDKGHESSVFIDNLRRGHKCRYCSVGASKPEQEIYDFVCSVVNGVKRNVRNVIPPYELDVFVPSCSLAVEYCGLHWHGEIIGMPRDYHYKKMLLCNDKDIRLLTIFEDEYINRPSVVLSRIMYALGLSMCSIGARKTVFKCIDKDEAKMFLNLFHLQGSSQHKVCFGLYFDGLLVQVMTFGSVSRPHATDSTTIELKRLASAPGFRVVGGASKLFVNAIPFIKSMGYKKIRSYLDMRYGNEKNNVYEKLGFGLVGESKHTPHYFKGQCRVRSNGLRKTEEERKTNKTEWELRKLQGYDRIWDCGHRTYDYVLV